MCGIFGVAGPSTSAAMEETLLAMGTAIQHRGPDDRGHLVSRRHAIGMGMTRLSIVDRAGGHQPIFNEDRSLAIVLNGEIYNHLALRQELELNGHRFSTASDAEAVLHLFEQDGPDSVSRLNGMFAFAIFNLKTGDLFFARDRFGVKPFFFATGGRFDFVFASEVKAFAAIKGFDVQTDPQAISDYFSYSYIPLPDSILTGVKQLMPGHWMIRKITGETTDHRYWTPTYRDIRSAEKELPTERELIDEFRMKFKSAVERQLLGEVPIGAFLSGGLDSGTIVAMMHELEVRPLHTFSVGFDSKDFDETDLLMQTANKFGTQHHHISFSGGDVADLVDTVSYSQDHPLGLTSYAYFLMAKAASEHVTVALSGDGGDELLGGYDMYYGHGLLERYRKLPPFVRSIIEKGIVDRLPHSMSKRGLDVKARKFIEAARLSATRSYLAWREAFLPEEKQRLLLKRDGFRLDPYACYSSYLEDESIQPIENRLMNADLNQFLVGTTLTIADRIGMANSIEIRVPFLDNDFFDFASGLEMKWKLRGTQTKVLMRKAMKGILPDVIIGAPKLGFTPPLGQWFKSALKPRMMDLLDDQELRSRALIDFGYARAVYEEHLQGKQDHSRRLMTLFSYLNWEKVFRTRAGAIQRAAMVNWNRMEFQRSVEVV